GWRGTWSGDHYRSTLIWRGRTPSRLKPKTAETRGYLPIPCEVVEQGAETAPKRTAEVAARREVRRDQKMFLCPHHREDRSTGFYRLINLALTTNTIQGIYKTKSQMPPFHHTGPKDPMKSKRQSLSQNNRTSHFIEEKPRAQEKYSINPLKGKDSNKGISLLCQDQDTKAPVPAQLVVAEWHTGDETRSNDANKRPDHTPGKQIPLNPVECGGNFKGEPKTSTYSELFAKARNTHYLRHQVPPESERLLSIGEISGHKESSQYRAEKGCKNRVTI
ncbi:hypothetical protein EI555_016336, partial [Monodon monoceros]